MTCNVLVMVMVGSELIDDNPVTVVPFSGFRQGFLRENSAIVSACFIGLLTGVSVVLFNYGDLLLVLLLVFNVNDYGAKGDEKTDNAVAFLRTWKEACDWKGGRRRVLIPHGKYKLGPVIFVGPCKDSIIFIIKGILVARTDRASLYTDHWLSFRYINGLTITGGGVLDGQGASAWPYNDCHKNTRCKPLPVTMRFDFVRNADISYITSLNSKNSHMNIYGCSYMNLSHIRLSSPADSPNTDGIHIGDSGRIKISRMVISTGDDCISFSPGSKKISVSDVACGPGHGISIGSLGRYEEGESVTRLIVKNCTFNGTTNGIRIKTWGDSYTGYANDFMFKNILMFDVHNPIIIDQFYCPYPPCNQMPSRVEISNVTFRNIRGTSSTKVAVNLQCSKGAPCKEIKLENINLLYSQAHHLQPATSNCSNVYGRSYGFQHPPSCL